MREKAEFHIISFTRTGFLLSLRMCDAFTTTVGFPDGELPDFCKKNNSDTKENSGSVSVYLYTKKEDVAAKFPEAEFVAESLADWCANVFARATALIFIGAAGIAVRTIAPFLGSKASDPAVLVADEQGRHIISLLSGHFGGGNDLTERLAAMLGADPVITTASDVNGRLAVDVWAKKNNCVIADFSAAKRVAAEIVEGKRIPVCVEVPMEGVLPEEFVLQKKENDSERNFEKAPDSHGTAENISDRVSTAISENVSDRAGIVISVYQDTISEDYPANLHEKNSGIVNHDAKNDLSINGRRNLHLIPRTVVLGIGCKKAKSLAEIRGALERVLAEQSLCIESIGAVVSIDLKRDEPGLVALAQELNAPFLTFSAQDLREVPGEYASSAFVEKTTGVDNVCERAAMAALTPEERDAAHFLCRKQAINGVTVALLLKPWRIDR